jgi:hypothetical protein
LFTNTLSGTLPTQLGRSTKLINFDISSNLFTGTLPSEYSNWANILYADFSGNSFGGTIPTQYGRLTSIYSLYEDALAALLSKFANFPFLATFPRIVSAEQFQRSLEISLMLSIFTCGAIRSLVRSQRSLDD